MTSVQGSHNDSTNNAQVAHLLTMSSTSRQLRAADSCCATLRRTSARAAASAAACRHGHVGDTGFRQLHRAHGSDAPC